MDDLRHVIATILHHRPLADDHVAFLDLASEQAVQIGQQRADHNADEEGDRHEQQHHADHLQPMPVIEAGDRLAEGVDGIAERDERVDRAEESRHHIDRV